MKRLVGTALLAAALGFGSGWWGGRQATAHRLMCRQAIRQAKRQLALQTLQAQHQDQLELWQGGWEWQHHLRDGTYVDLQRMYSVPEHATQFLYQGSQQMRDEEAKELQALERSYQTALTQLWARS